ncbi:MAG TPA: M56 family metallopeptidase [Terriglobales bacterium]|nr:M56 family metallopeptidase [Terriglobales bacterium]
MRGEEMLRLIFQTVFNLSLIGTAMIAVVAAVRGLSLRKRLLQSSFFVLLWMMILLRMVTPFSVPFLSVNSFLGSYGAGWPEAQPASEADGKPSSQIQSDGVNPQGGEAQTSNTGLAGKGGLGATSGAQELKPRNDVGLPGGNTRMTAYALIPLLWLAGAALMAGAFLTVWLLTVLREKDSARISYAGWQKIKSISKTGRDIPLKLLKNSSSNQGPHVSGVFSPAIILPAPMGCEQSELTDHILLHELTHIRHFDNLKKAVAAFALCLHWFNPVFWLCWVLFLRDLECSCDEKVVRLLGAGERKNYAQSIYEFACRSQHVLLCHFSASGKTAVASRVKRILEGTQKLSFAGMLSLGTAFSLLTAGFAVTPLMRVSPAPPAESFLVYAASDGLYRTDLTADRPVKIFDGQWVSHPVLSQNGDMVMFRQGDMAPQDGPGPVGMSCYIYTFEFGRTIPLAEPVYSYCAGPYNSFVIGTTDGKLLKVSIETTRHDGAGAPEYRTEDISVWPAAVEKDPLVSIQYENLKPSPGFRYLAYNVDVKDERTDNRPEGFGPYSSGGLYVLDLETGKAAAVVNPIRATEQSFGNNPEPGPWSPDGKTLWVWDKPQSGSLSADGVGGFFYHAGTGERTECDSMMLGYDENISYSGAGTAATLGGGGREMFSGKRIDLTSDYSGEKAQFQELKSISEKGLVPAMPQLSADGKTLYFAATSRTDTDGNAQTYPLKRQLYSIQPETGEVSQITSDPNYRNENPVLLKDGAHLIFGRASAGAYDGKMEIWTIDLQSGEETRLAAWAEPDPENVWMSGKYDDYYGRGCWSGIFAVCDGTAAG